MQLWKTTVMPNGSFAPCMKCRPIWNLAKKDACTPSFESYISVLEDVYRAVGSDDYQDGCEAYSRFLKEISAFSSQNNSFVRSADDETPRVEAILFHNRESIVSVIQTIGEYFDECRTAGTAPAYTDMLEYLEDRAAEDLEKYSD